MKTIKVSEATGPALDWLVAKCENKELCIARPDLISRGIVTPRPYSTSWSQGGPIVNHLLLENGMVLRCWVEQGLCEASLDSPHRFSTGPTPLIAAMRCYVKSKLGEMAEVPEELA